MIDALAVCTLFAGLLALAFYAFKENLLSTDVQSGAAAIVVPGAQAPVVPSTERKHSFNNRNDGLDALLLARWTDSTEVGRSPGLGEERGSNTSSDIRQVLQSVSLAYVEQTEVRRH